MTHAVKGFVTDGPVFPLTMLVFKNLAFSARWLRRLLMKMA
jgi:hypothetical protein